jgi:hypothetical protein
VAIAFEGEIPAFAGMTEDTKIRRSSRIFNGIEIILCAAQKYP